MKLYRMRFGFELKSVFAYAYPLKQKQGILIEGMRNTVDLLYNITCSSEAVKSSMRYKTVGK